MRIMILHGWEIFERKSKSSSSMVYLVSRVIHRRGRIPETEYMCNHGIATGRLRGRPSVFRSREAAERAIVKATRKSQEGEKQ